MGVLRGARFAPPPHYHWVTTYSCKNYERCGYDHTYYCYLAPAELPPDKQFCPDCGALLENQYLTSTYYETVRKIDYCELASPIQYNLAFENIELFYRNMISSQDPARWRKLTVPGVDLLIRYSPVLFDDNALLLAESFISRCSLEKYRAVNFPLIKKYLDFLRSYYLNLPVDQKLRQSDLLADYRAGIASMLSIAGDLSDVTYFWAGFGYVDRETIKNRVYFSRKPTIPELPQIRSREVLPP